MSAVLATNDWVCIKRNLMALRESEPRAWSKFSVCLGAEIFIAGKKKKKPHEFFPIQLYCL